VARRKALSGNQAELLYDKWARMNGWRTAPAKKVAVRIGKGKVVTKAHDHMGVWDFINLHPKRGQVVFGQITTQAGRAERRRKILEAGPWPTILAVSYILVSHETTEDPAHRGRSLDWWRVEALDRDEKGRPFWGRTLAYQFSKRDVEEYARRGKEQKITS
jgi:hypothetical protein